MTRAGSIDRYDRYKLELNRVKGNSSLKESLSFSPALNRSQRFEQFPAKKGKADARLSTTLLRTNSPFFTLIG